ncbi:replication initiator protein RepSA [Kitasatospora sp. NPDC101801]|uniref:replication initiator protein RepSA n=1 Tax=Kitasatospora sp. NPDC101801 TaxID=3364103 RepID=UPI0037F119C1
MTNSATQLPGWLDRATFTDLVRVASRPDLPELRHQIERTGGCAQPIHIAGWRHVYDRASGRIIKPLSYSTMRQPGGRLRLACGNRRASRCPSCAYTYAGDTYHLMMSGLRGGKGIPYAVGEHPRVFATLTAPSFGPVHNRPDRRCCRCGAAHGEDDPLLGTPLDPAGYDYAGAVLWNNHAGALWQRFTIYLRRELAKRAGVAQRDLKGHCRVAFAKVAEFQRRGAVHFHAVIRLDGPDGAGDAPPSWASTELLDDAIRAAAARVTLPVPASGEHMARTLGWGKQVDVQPIGGTALAGEDLDDGAVASYVAKYATKAAETTQTVDRRIAERSDVDKLTGLPAHTRRLIEACWDLDAAYPDRLLAHWSHMLGFRGHFSTKARTYGTTLGALRQVRADFRARQDRQEHGQEGGTEGATYVVSHWRFAGVGHTPGESLIAAQVASDKRTNRETARQELPMLLAQEGEDSWIDF